MPQKYEREIEEILNQVADVPPGSPRRGQPRRRRGLPQGMRRTIRALLGLLSPGKFLLASLVLVLLAVFFRASFPGWVGPLAWTGIVLFILAYALFFISPPFTYEKRWRGQPIGPTRRRWWQRLRRRF